MHVIRDERLADYIFNVAVATAAIFNCFSMGCATPINCVWRHLQQPSTFLVAFACQFIMMPLVRTQIESRIWQYSCSPLTKPSFSGKRQPDWLIYYNNINIYNIIDILSYYHHQPSNIIGMALFIKIKKYTSNVNIKHRYVWILIQNCINCANKVCKFSFRDYHDFMLIWGNINSSEIICSNYISSQCICIGIITIVRRRSDQCHPIWLARLLLGYREKLKKQLKAWACPSAINATFCNQVFSPSRNASY